MATMVASFGSLPNEVMLQVFRHLDGSSLTRSGRVCKRWYDLVTAILRHPEVWKIMCLHEIHHDIIAELLGPQMPRSSSDVDDATAVKNCSTADWFALYKQWHSSAALRSRASRTQAFEIHGSDLVTCSCVTGNVIVTAHRGGTVGFWSARTGQELRTTPAHRAGITDLTLVDIARTGPYEDAGERFTHSHLVSASKDRTVCVMPVCIKKNGKTVRRAYGHAVVSVRVSGDYLVVLVEGNTAHVYRLLLEDGAKGRFGMVAVGAHRLETRLRAWMGTWGSQVAVISNEGKLFVIQLPELSRDFSHTKDLKLFGAGQVILDGTCIQRSGTAITRSLNQGLFVSVDRCANFTTELVGPNSPGSVTSLALHGSLLALGFSHGRLSLYGVPSPSDLVGLNISQPVWEKLLDDAAIITVGVAFDFTSLLPIVVAASAYCIFIIRWD